MLADPKQVLTAYDITGEEFHHTMNDVDTLYALARDLPPSPILVNIGTCFGTSIISLLEFRLDAFIFSIDINECPTAIENLKKAGLYDLHRVVRVLGRSQEVGRFWPEKVDFVFVDGAHNYDAVVEDIHYWRPRIKIGGIMACHDYGKSFLPHVKRAIDETMFDNCFEVICHIDSIIAFEALR